MPGTEPPLPNWPGAHGAPLFRGLIRQNADEFRVDEEPGFACSGDGEHDFLRVEKRDANTEWVARNLARHAGVPVRDVGYAGQKDRHALTTQWFSVRRPTRQGTDWRHFAADGVRILETSRHDRKLRRGSHRGNRFEIVIRGRAPARAAIDDRLTILRQRGVPNYFGPQRFGRDGGNLGLAGRLFAGERLRRDTRSMALSAARSFLFNEILARRVESGSWGQVLPGEAVNLDGSGSFFVTDRVTTDIEARAAALDLHPTGALWGRGAPGCGGLPAALESQVAGLYPAFANGLERAEVDVERRPLRLAIRDLGWEVHPDRVALRFRLGRGAFATAVLREIADLDDA